MGFGYSAHPDSEWHLINAWCSGTASEKPKVNRSSHPLVFKGMWGDLGKACAAESLQFRVMTLVLWFSSEPPFVFHCPGLGGSPRSSSQRQWEIHRLELLGHFLPLGEVGSSAWQP